MQPRNPWEDYNAIVSTSPTKNLIPAHVDPADLIDIRTRVTPTLQVFAAYAQDNHVFDADGNPKPVDADTYAATPRILKVNKFKQAYKFDAKVQLHKEMADIVTAAADFMWKQDGWRTLVYDGLRTVDGAYNIYANAEDSDLTDKLLAPPGLSAHNKGMAVDLVQFDKTGKLVDMGGNFDHLDMTANHRNNMTLPAPVIENRIKREIAFQHAALLQGKLFAPLRTEFWDERFPENEADHWRVLESLCRCIGKTFLSAEDIINLKFPSGSPERKAFHDKWEAMNYDQFTQYWRILFNDEQMLRTTLQLPADLKLPPARSTVIYHGDYHPIYDQDLTKAQQMTDSGRAKADLVLPKKAENMAKRILDSIGLGGLMKS